MKRFIPLILCNIAFGFDVLSVADILIDHTVQLSDQEVEKYIQYKDGTEHIDLTKYGQIQKKFESRAQVSSGGSQAITFKALAYLGCNCNVVGTMGKDIWGQRYLDILDEHHINVTPIYTSKMTGQCFCFLDPRGNRSMMTCLSASLALKEEHIANEPFKKADLYYASAYSIFNEACFFKTLKLAKKHGAKIALDLGSYNLIERFSDKFLDIIERYVDVLFANIDEGHALTGLTTLEEVASRLAPLCEAVIIHSGEEGGMIAANNKLYRYGAIPVKKVVDTTCAGDLFAAGYLYGYLNKLPVAESALYGAALGSAIIQTHGSTLPQAILKSIPCYVEKQRKHFKFSIVN